MCHLQLPNSGLRVCYKTALLLKHKLMEVPRTEVMRYDGRVVGAKREALITYGQTLGVEPCAPDQASRVMHAHLVHKEFELMARDAPPGVTFEGMKGIMLALIIATAADATRIVAAFADDGTVQMPLNETFWASTFGMVTDRYGIPWGVNGRCNSQPKL